MPAPHYNNIKTAASGTPGTGAFTPGVTSSSYIGWATIPAGWMGLVRFEDGSDFSLEHCYWDGTSLSRSSSQVALRRSGTPATSTGSHLSLTSAATAAMVVDSDAMMPHLGGTPWVGSFAQINTSISNMRGGTTTETGTASSQTLSTSSFIGEQVRRQYTSATTANAQAGWSSPSSWAVVNTTAGRGGFELVTRFGVTGLPTGPRLFNCATSATFVASTAEPSALTAHLVGFAKDSTDTNIQFLTNSNAGGGTKIDTGIPLAVNGYYETSSWMEPGGGRAFGVIYRLDNGSIWVGSTATDIPNAATTLRAECLGGLNGTDTGTAIVMQMSSMMVRGGT